MSCLDADHGMETNADFYRTLVLDRDEHVDSKYDNDILIGYVSVELFKIDLRSELKFSVGCP